MNLVVSIMILRQEALVVGCNSFLALISRPDSPRQGFKRLICLRGVDLTNNIVNVICDLKTLSLMLYLMASLSL